VLGELCVLLCLVVTGELPTSLPDGTVIAVTGGSRIIMRHTGSRYTHTAIVFNGADGPYVYEATKPYVRRVALAKYEAAFTTAARQYPRWDATRIEVWVPKIPYTASEIAAMRSWAVAQLGRKYSLLSYVFGRRKVRPGIHCTAYVSWILNKSGKYRFCTPQLVTPGQLVSSIASDYQKR